jgi:AmmeMemoRadiSam system protein A
MQLTDDEKRELLRRARASIEAELKGIPNPTSPPTTSTLETPCGAFVTLRIGGDLRGCIGYVEPRLPLVQTVEEVAKKAAFEDPRFVPLTRDELDAVDIEISVLSPLWLIKDISEIEVGKHGLVVDAGYTRGLLLPQVPLEYGWDRQQFLAHTSLKAGLMPDAWKQPHVKLFVFTSDVFSERSLHEHDEAAGGKGESLT